MTKQFAPMNEIKREPSGKFYRALVGPKLGQVGEAVTFYGWGGVSLRFGDGAVATYADSDVVEVVAPEAEEQS
jgi:hypothetical protein